MKPLTAYFKNRRDFKLVERRGDWAIFHGVARDNGVETYEVVRIRVHQGFARTFPRDSEPTVVEPAEYPPSDKEWGTYGFTCTTLEQAQECLARQISLQKKEPTDP